MDMTHPSPASREVVTHVLERFKIQPSYSNSVVFETCWMVGDNECGFDLVDAPTRGKAKLRQPGDLDYLHVKARRRRDCDGLTYRDAFLVVWPCKDGHDCKGCPCCEEGRCGEDENASW
jgi:hypothetical protein